MVAGVAQGDVLSEQHAHPVQPLAEDVFAHVELEG
jgi:hypothetical protein